MNTFQDMRNFVLKLYKEALEKYPIPEYDSTSFLKANDDSDFPPGDLDRKVYIADAILSLDDGIKDRLIMLLALYYYAYNIYEDSDKKELEKIENDIIEAFDFDEIEEEMEEETDDEESLLDIINNCDKEALLESVVDSSNDYLYDLIDIILDEDIKLYSEETLKRGYILDTDYYSIVCQQIEREDVKKVFSCYHPNMKKEDKIYKEYQKKEYYFEKLTNMNVVSTKDFIEKFLMAKQLLNDNSYLYSFVIYILKEIKNSNKNIYNEICIFILRYYYITKYLHEKEAFETAKKDIVWQVQDLDVIDDFILKEFLNFDFTLFMQDFSKLPKEIIDEFTDLVNLENTTVYGSDGIWEEYSEEKHKNNIFKYSPHFDVYIKANLNKDRNIYIYVSKDKNGNFKIPRVCLICDKNNNIVSIIGRGVDWNIEFDFLDIVALKIKDCNNSDLALKKLIELNKIKKIKNKIENGIELTVEDIDYLYNITNTLTSDDTNLNNFDIKKESDFMYENDVLKSVRESSDLKKDLSKYYGCKISEVATSFDELNENTVVTTIFSPSKDVCAYPKLKAIFGTAWGNYLRVADGLNNLEYIKGSANFENLISSKGLEKLKYIGGDATFTNMQDASYFDKNLIIKGNVYFEYGDDPRAKQFKK